MKNYICINGNTTELTDEQVRELGFPVDCPSAFSELLEAIRSGKARERYYVSDTVTVGGIELEIIGFDHDKGVINPDEHTVTLMGKTLLPARRMHSSACERGWIDTELRKWLNSEFIKELPSELTENIVEVEKISNTDNVGSIATFDRLFIPSESEMFGSAIYSGEEEGARYEAFCNSESRVRVDEVGDTAWYWTRSLSGGHSTSFCGVYGDGLATRLIASYAAFRVPLCFTIA